MEKYRTTDLKDAASIYSELGFVLVKNFVSGSFLDLLKSESNQLIDSCTSGPITRRMQLNTNFYINDFPSVWGINDFICDFSSNSKYQLVKDLLRATKNITSMQNLNMLSLNRIHFQRQKFLHKLFWHHDSVEYNKNFVTNLYLEKETGFRITDKLNSVNSISVNTMGRGGMYFSLRKDYYTISAEPGDLLIFDGRLLHQPYNKHSRLHLHFVFQNNFENVEQRNLFDENVCLDRNKPMTFPKSYRIYSKTKYVVQSILDWIF